MLNVEYSEKILKDLIKLRKNKIYNEIKLICFTELPSYEKFSEVTNLRKLNGFREYYRIRIRDYRVGLKVPDDKIVIMRVLHRKEIYRYFP